MRCSTSTLANALHVARIETGEDTEIHVNKAQSDVGRKGGAARAKTLTAKRRKEIALEGAKARWT